MNIMTDTWHEDTWEQVRVCEAGAELNIKFSETREVRD